jgi:hypothetical protein
VVSAIKKSFMAAIVFCIYEGKVLLMLSLFVGAAVFEPCSEHESPNLQNGA